MAKKKSTPSAPPNFIDLRQEALKRNGNLIDDVLRPILSQRKLKHSYFYVAGGVLIVIVIASLVFGHSKPQTKAASIVPVSVSSKVNFPIYYPDATKLPTGYQVDGGSFSAGKDAVLFTMHNAKKQQLNFSEQVLPSSQQLQTFYTQRIPLYNNVTTPVGTARVSALNGQAFISLPTDKTWVLITAPYDINQTELKQVLNALVN